MPASLKSPKNNKRSPKRTPAKRKIIASGPRSRFSGRPLALVVALLFGAVGVYMLVQSNALQPDEELLSDEPARGLVYKGEKVKTKGPCAGSFDLTTDEDVKKNGKVGNDIRRCAHLDPTPLGVDIRERIKTVDDNLKALAAHDEKNKPAVSDETFGYEQAPLAEPTISGANMDGIGARDWPCFGTGRSGARVQLIYVYPANGTDRLSEVRPGLAAIARRMNSIFYTSGAESGNAHQIRFETNNGDPDCALRIASEPIAASELDNSSYIRSKLIERGYKGTPSNIDFDGDGVSDYTDYVDRKFLIWIDKKFENSEGQLTRCGLGEMRTDASPGQKNENNTSVTYAWIWKGCWNYGEPHELMHMLGGVQSNAPYATPGHHCKDERDIMCYDDDTLKWNGTKWVDSDGVIVNTFLRCDRTIDLWRMDCKHDAYYRGNDPASGYLSNHWNTANSQFLTP